MCVCAGVRACGAGVSRPARVCKLSVCVRIVRVRVRRGHAHSVRAGSGVGSRCRTSRLSTCSLRTPGWLVGGGGGLAERTNAADAHNVNTHSHTLRSAVLRSTFQCRMYVCVCVYVWLGSHHVHPSDPANSREPTRFHIRQWFRECPRFSLPVSPTCANSSVNSPTRM